MEGEQKSLLYKIPPSEREQSETDSECTDGDIAEEIGCDLELMDLCNHGEQSDDDEVDLDSFSDSELDEAEKDYESRRLNALNVSISDVSDLSEWVKSQQLEWSQLVHQYISTSGEQTNKQRTEKSFQVDQPGRGR